MRIGNITTLNELTGFLFFASLVVACLYGGYRCLQFNATYYFKGIEEENNPTHFFIYIGALITCVLAWFFGDFALRIYEGDAFVNRPPYIEFLHTSWIFFSVIALGLIIGTIFHKMTFKEEDPTYEWTRIVMLTGSVILFDWICAFIIVEWF